MNSTIRLQLEHKTIRKFKEIEIPEEIVSTLIDVARHTSTSSFMQAYSIIRVSDPGKKEKLAQFGKQDYIAQAPLLLVMLSDMHRNTKIAQENSASDIHFASFDRFLSSSTDAILAAQNIMIAAESLGLGGVFLGSILNQADKIIEVLELPDYVVPVLGIGIGYPDQEPQLKPRLPQAFMFMEDRYQLPDLAELQEYDALVNQYYDLRDANRRVDKFTTQVTRYAENPNLERSRLLDIFRSQKIIKY